MRPKYDIQALVLARTPVAEASTLLHLLTSEFGLVRARAQGLRKPGAKLAGATQTLSEFEAILVRGKEVWRLSGATLTRNRFRELSSDARARAGRVAKLILRLVHGEMRDKALYESFMAYLCALPTLSSAKADAAECVAVLSILRALGLDAGTIPGGEHPYREESLDEVEKNRRQYILRINHGITASGL